MVFPSKVSYFVGAEDLPGSKEKGVLRLKNGQMVVVYKSDDPHWWLGKVRTRAARRGEPGWIGPTQGVLLGSGGGLVLTATLGVVLAADQAGHVRSSPCSKSIYGRWGGREDIHDGEGHGHRPGLCRISGAGWVLTVAGACT